MGNETWGCGGNMRPEFFAGVNARSVSGRILTAPAMDARNTVDKPEAVKPAPFKGTRKGDEIRVELPPKSVVVVAVE